MLVVLLIDEDAYLAISVIDEFFFVFALVGTALAGTRIDVGMEEAGIRNTEASRFSARGNYWYLFCSRTTLRVARAIERIAKFAPRVQIVRECAIRLTKFTKPSSPPDLIARDCNIQL